ncbi:hypothetical protein ACHAXT_002331 [Thalassiosira profunda]
MRRGGLAASSASADGAGRTLIKPSPDSPEMTESALDAGGPSHPPPSSNPAVATIAVDDVIHKRIPSTQLMGRAAAQTADIRGRENFPMGCAFSPDGTCVLTATAADGKFRLYDTPFHHLMRVGAGAADDDGPKDEGDGGDKGETDDAAVATTRPQHEEATQPTTHSHSQNYHPQTTQQQTQGKQSAPHPWKASLTSHQGGPPPSSSSAGYAWYPLMTSASPLTSFYAACRGPSVPIHLIDAYTSNLRASYRPYNGVDEMEGPTVVEFSPDGSRIFGTGFKTDRTIAVFDTSMPGREGMIARLGKTRRSADGQKGIPSALAFPPSSGDSGPSNVFAVGAYSPASIYIYDDRMSHFQPAGTIVLHGGLAVVGHGKKFAKKKRRFGEVDNAQEGEEDLFSAARVHWFQSRARGGVTQLAWAPAAAGNPYVLFSASRRSDAVLSWDVRALSGNEAAKAQPICGLKSYARDGDTNQRIEFDFDGSGRRLFTGTAGGEGVVKVYDVTSGALEGTVDVGARDAVNGVSCVDHPSGSLLAVAVGSRRFDEPETDEEDAEGLTSAEMCPGFLQVRALDACTTNQQLV